MNTTDRMKNTSTTPGPWHAVPDHSPRQFRVYINGSGTGTITTIKTKHAFAARALADGLLMAAAPTMRDALRAVEERCDESDFADGVCPLCGEETSIGCPDDCPRHAVRAALALIGEGER